jgi:hypothetical protein
LLRGRSRPQWIRLDPTQRLQGLHLRDQRVIVACDQHEIVRSWIAREEQRIEERECCKFDVS